MAEVNEINNEPSRQQDLLYSVLLAACEKVHHIFHVVSAPDFKLLMMNNAMEDFLRSVGIIKPQDEFVGKHFWDIIPGWKSSLLPIYEDAFSAGRPLLHRDIRLDTPTKPTYWDASIVPNVDALTGQTTSISFLAMDVTERKMVEDNLRLSEETFRMVVEKSIDGMFVGRADNKTIIYNKAMENISGYTMEEVNEKGWFNLVYPDPKQRKEALRYALDVIEGRLPYMEMPITRKDGQVVWVSFHSSFICLRGRKYILGRLIDITERKKNEEDLALVSKAVESSGEAVGIINTDMKTVFYNPAYVKLFGYTSEELNNSIRRPHNLFADSSVADEIINTVTAGEHWDGEVKLQCKNGKIVPVILHADSVKNDEGKIIGYVAIITDISEQKKFEQELSAAKEAAERAAEREAEARTTLQVIFDTVPVGILMGDADTKQITYFSPGAVNLLGGPVTQDASKAISESYKILRPSDRSLLPVDEMPIMRALVHGEETRNVELLIERWDGSEVMALANSTPVFDQDGRITAAVVSLTDITEMVELRRTMEHQMTQLERALIPKQPSVGPGCRVATLYMPAFARREVAGDFYDVFNAVDGKSVIVIGDVSGKGVEAASLAAATRSTIHALAYHNPSPAEVLTQANAVLYTQQPWIGSFVTVFLAVFDPVTGDLRYSNAGHPPGIVFRYKTGKVEIMSSAGIVIGVLESCDFSEFYTKLEPRDKFLLYTDGISEAWPGHGEFFGSEGIAEVVEKYGCKGSDELIQKILDAARAWAGGVLSDDAAIVAVECIGME